jgi:hypothetical protein
MRIRFDLIAANNRAVKLLHEASYSRAIHTLENALQFLRAVAVETSEASAAAAAAAAAVADSNGSRNRRTASGTRADQGPPQDEQQAPGRHVGDLHIRTSPHKCELWPARGPDGFFSFCSRPMVLAGTQEQVVRSAHNQNRAASALMYNLSLAYQGAYGSQPMPPPPHARAPGGSTSTCPPPTSSPSSLSFAGLGDRILKCSLKICTMAVDLMSRVPAHRTTPGDSVLYVSCLNNQGFLHVHFSNRAGANRSMSMLQCYFASHAPDDADGDFEYEHNEDATTATTDSHGRNAAAYKSAVNDVVYSVLLCQGRTVLDAAPAA